MEKEFKLEIGSIVIRNNARMICHQISNGMAKLVRGYRNGTPIYEQIPVNHIKKSKLYKVEESN